MVEQPVWSDDELRVIADRIQRVYERVFGGNQSRMARSLSLSQPVVSRVLSGRQLPSRRMIEALASHPAVNSEFLLGGHGDPEAKPSPVPTEGLPVAVCPLPGLPAHYRQFLTGQYVTCCDLVTDTRYLVEITPASSLAQSPELCIAPGDWLVIETDPVALRVPALLDGRLCLVAPRTGNRKDVDFVRVRVAYGTGALFGTPIGAVQAEIPPRTGVHRHRGLVFDEPPAKPSRPKTAEKRDEYGSHRLSFEEIVGVVVELRRRNV